MDSILSKVNFETHSVYNIKLKVSESDLYDDKQAGEVDSDGQELGITADLRRAIKSSHPSDKKKIIKSIIAHDEDEFSSRDLELEYYLLVENEEVEEFSTEELHDVLEEEWHTGSSGCNIVVSAYEA